jgi:hypothetical protein
MAGSVQPLNFGMLGSAAEVQTCLTCVTTKCYLMPLHTLHVTHCSRDLKKAFLLMPVLQYIQQNWPYWNRTQVRGCGEHQVVQSSRDHRTGSIARPGLWWLRMARRRIYGLQHNCTLVSSIPYLSKA